MMNFDVTPVEVVTREFVAVILAGFGNELLPLTGEHGDEPCPKALLPISNKPMLDYPLSWVEQSGIKDVLLICPSSHRSAISHYIHSQSSSASFSSVHIDLQTFDESQELSAGTCSVLRHFANRIKEDFILIPCDFIPPPSLPLSKLLNKFRTDTMSDGSIVTSCWYEHKSDKQATQDEWGWGSPAKPTPIVWDHLSGTLLYVDSPYETDKNRHELELRMTLLSRYPQAKLSSMLLDSHVYVCKRAVLDLLARKTRFDSLRDDFFPWLCKLQYQSTKQEKYATSIRIGIIIHRADDGFAIRVNNLPAYLEANRHFVADTSIGDFTRVEEKSTIKNSTIGKHCVIGKMVKIVGCVLLDHCVISDGAKLDGCILGNSTTVGMKAELVKCVTQAGYEVKDNESVRHEKLDISDWAAQPEDSEGDDEDSIGEEESDEDED
ncbi:UDP-3-O-glucosamine N-acyltransferase [Suillus fuscotomentosus]|uniref:Translation initiation factor eIF2B subunit gamma n=1 Tax=Suillus fuscotomentosus TaxID=1912939 RepID=A0AAD4DXP0_9AGAM|nr:UDP-3-O-glucosamine N-acyltransferase [Suillus fuscotomentosus]KAG1895562.1 UDP-3-O-glucosamine N-acyltransferase [Suillus fuscotomentosus]